MSLFSSDPPVMAIPIFSPTIFGLRITLIDFLRMVFDSLSDLLPIDDIGYKNIQKTVSEIELKQQK